MMRPSLEPISSAAHLALAALLLPWMACGPRAEEAPQPPSSSDVAWAPLRAEALPSGLSGWSADPGGTLWAIPERTAELVPLRAERSGVTSAGPRLRIDGLRPGEQTESIAALGNGRWIVGTEGEGIRDSDSLLWLHGEGPTARVERRLAVPYALWQRKGEDNRGIEGLCTAAGQVLIAVEPVGQRDGKRLGLMARYVDGRFQAIRFPLSTDSGKIAGIDCRLEGDRITVVAIERHYRVCRLLRLSLPRESAAEPLFLEATVLRDLRKVIEDPPNFEGISWREDGYWLLSDNDHGGVTGPTQVLWVATSSPRR